MTTSVTTQTSGELAQAAKLQKNIRMALTYAGMIFLGFIFLFPIIFMVVAAFKPNDRVIADLATFRAFLPDFSTLTTANITDVFDRVSFWQYAFNSLLVTLVTVITGLFVNSMAAFVLARLNWPGRSMILGIIVSLIIIPLEAIAVPLMMQVNEMGLILNLIVTIMVFALMLLMWAICWNVVDKFFDDRGWDMPKMLGFALKAICVFLITLPFEILVYYMIPQTLAGGTWLDSYHVQILPFIAEPFSIFLFYQFFIGIPKDFDEAAVVDGASAFRIYWQIVVPISRPVFATVAILKFLQFWSFYLWPLMVTRSDGFRPLMVGMDFFQTQQPILWGSIMAYAAMVTIPVLIVFLLFQKWFIQSVSSSGVKG